MIIFDALRLLLFPYPKSFKKRLKWFLLNLAHGSFFCNRKFPTTTQTDNIKTPWNTIREHFCFVNKYYKSRHILQSPVVCSTMFLKNEPKHKVSNNQINLEIKQIAKEWSSCLNETQSNIENWMSAFGAILMKAEELNPRFIDKMKSSKLIEFGPGLGAMSVLYSRLFQTETFLFDLPELTILRSIIFELLSENGHPGYKSFQQYHDFDTLVSKKPTRFNFISTWAFTESPIELREKFFPMLQDSETILIVSNKHFGDVDNFAYFKRFIEKIKSFTLFL